MVFRALLARRLVAGVVTAAVMGAGGLAAAGAADHGPRAGAHKTHAAHVKKAAHAKHAHVPGSQRHAALIDSMHPFRVAAKVIGMSTRDLYQAVMHDGMSIAAVAQAHGVNPATVIAVLERAGFGALSHSATMLGAPATARVNGHLSALVTNLVNGHRGALFHKARAHKAATKSTAAAKH